VKSTQRQRDIIDRQIIKFIQEGKITTFSYIVDKIRRPKDMPGILFRIVESSLQRLRKSGIIEFVKFSWRMKKIS
jgi:hypothetical protein